MKTKAFLRKILLFLTIISLCLCTIGFIIDCFRGTTPPESVGSVRLNIETYLAGANQPTHPSVVSFKTPWNGYSYWMAYSPYPYANGEEENPCVAASNDLLYWETPVGLANPIGNNEETGCDELKDPHIVYREDLDQLEIWYLGRQAVSLGGDGTSLLLMRKCSKDGVHWSELEIMAQTEYLSPSILWDGQKYQMWAIGYDLWGTEGTFVYQESSDGIHWSEPTPCSVGQACSELDIWHGAVSKYLGIYHFVFIDYEKQQVFYCFSDDGITFSEPEVIVNNGEYWDHLYRPALLFEDSTVTCFYGVVNQENQWYLSSSSGAQVNALSGLRENDVTSMISLYDEVIDTHRFTYHLRTLFHAVESYFRIELLLLVFLEALLLIIVPKFHTSRNFPPIVIILNLLLSCIYILYRFPPKNLINWSAAWISIVLLNIGSDAVLLCVQAALSNYFQKKN